MMSPANELPWAQVRLLGLDIDGTLTDGFLYWGGPEVGWTQRYSVRDGEAILRLAVHLPVVPISRNRTLCAKARMAGLGLSTEWVGVGDKLAAVDEVAAHHGVPVRSICYVGDGREDVPVLQRVGLPCSVSGSNPAAMDASAYTTVRSAGCAAVEEVIEFIMAAKGL
jgi:3-deoxy-D-manno-octulosonate 8-phosphate phosphatase (KDO 8-P phosphatase)